MNMFKSISIIPLIEKQNCNVEYPRQNRKGHGLSRTPGNRIIQTQDNQDLNRVEAVETNEKTDGEQNVKMDATMKIGRGIWLRREQCCEDMSERNVKDEENGEDGEVIPKTRILSVAVVLDHQYDPIHSGHTTFLPKIHPLESRETYLE